MVAVLPHHLALVGLMGAGKTTVGRLVAQQLGWSFVDLDERIEAATGSTVRELWARGGEGAYRPLEADHTLAVLGEPGPSVVAVPGGAVLDPRVASLLVQPGVAGVWLRAQPDALVARTRAGNHRPLLDDDPLAVLGAQASARAATYESVTALAVDTDDRSPAEVATAVVAWLRDRAPVEPGSQR